MVAKSSPYVEMSVWAFDKDRKWMIHDGHVATPGPVALRDNPFLFLTACLYEEGRPRWMSSIGDGPFGTKSIAVRSFG